MSNGIRQQPYGNLIVKTDGFKRGPSLKGRFQGRLTQGNVARFDVGRLERDLALRSKNLKKFINEGEFRKRLRQVVQQQKRPKPVFLK